MVLAAVPDYDRLSDLLVGTELAPSPAEAQGMLCGLLALHLTDALERWQAQLLAAPIGDADLDADSDADSDFTRALSVGANAPSPPLDLTFQERASSPAEQVKAHSCCDDHAHHHVSDHDHDHHHADNDAPAPAPAPAPADADERRTALEQLAVWTQSAIEPTALSFDLFLPPEDRPLQERASAVLDWVRGLLFGFALGGLGCEQLLGQAGEAFDDLVELTRMDLEAVVESDADEQALTEIVEFLRVAAMLIREDRGKALIEERDRHAAETGLH